VNDQPPSRSFEWLAFASYPVYIRTPGQRERWDVCAGIVSTMSSWLEPSGRPDPRFVWVGTRALYKSDTPTGEATPETTAALADLRKQRRRRQTELAEGP
jgi:hypothetical protein